MAQGERALEAVRRDGEASPMSAAVLRNLAGVAEQAERLDLARHYAEQAVADAEGSTGKTPLCGEYREYCAGLALREGDTEGAIEHLGWSLAIYEKALGPGAVERLAGPLQALALALRLEGRLPAALDLHERALRMLEGAGQQGGPAWSAQAGARIAVLEELDELEEARRAFAAWTAAVEPSVPEAERAETRQQWARRWLAWGRPQEARALLPTAPGAPERSAELHGLQAEGAAQAGAWQEALRHVGLAEEALAAADRGPGRALVPELARLRARAQLGLGEPERAFEGLLELLHLEREQWGADSSRLVPTLLLLLEAELAGRRRVPELIDLLELLEGAQRWLAPLADAAFRRLERERTGRAAFDPALRAWLHLARKKPERLPACFAAVDRLRERDLLALHAPWIERGAARREPPLRELLELLRAEPGVEQAGREALRAQPDALAARLRQDGSPWGQALVAPAVDLAQVRGALVPGEVLLSFSWTSEGVFAALVPAAGSASLVELGAAGELGDLLGPALAALGDPARPFDLTALGKRLLAPLWSVLEGCASATIVADGPLALLPFEALPTAPAGEPWVLRCRVAYAPTVARWLRWAEGRADPAAGERVAHVLGGSRTPTASRFQLLRARAPGRPSASERGLARELPAEDLVLGSELALKRASAGQELAGIRLLELHADVFVDLAVPGATGIALGCEAQDELSLWEREDGLLDLGELRELDLCGAGLVAWSTRSAPPPEGAPPRSEGLRDLVTALSDAGAQGLWIADREALHDACFNFDNALREELRSGAPSQALARAQRRWLERAAAAPHLAHPAIWARLRYHGR